MNRALVASGATHPFSTDQQTSSFAAPVRPGLLRGWSWLGRSLTLSQRDISIKTLKQNEDPGYDATYMHNDMYLIYIYIYMYLIWWGAGHRGRQR